MSDENEIENEDGGENQASSENHLFNNFKEEMSRKMGNTQKQMEQLIASQNQIAELIANTNKPRNQDNSVESQSMSDLLYSDPDKYAQLLREEIKKEISAEIYGNLDKQTKTQQEEAEVLNSMIQKFPELGVRDSELSKKAIELFDQMPDSQKSNKALAYKAAINEAAIELDLKPYSKRKNQEDDGDFRLRGGNHRSSQKSNKLDERTALFAKLVGLDPDDKKTAEKLKKHSQRNFGRYGG